MANPNMGFESGTQELWNVAEALVFEWGTQERGNKLETSRGRSARISFPSFLSSRFKSVFSA
jgi:hypothetical protein